jgi:tRNA (uracil-5-)-methyltransferase TRM9
MAIPQHLVEALGCPEHPDDTLAQAPGRLTCPVCGRVFGSREGIFSLMPAGAPEDPEAAALMEGEEQQRDLEAGGYDEMLGLQVLSPLEVPSTVKALRPRRGSRSVEVGCGTGRMTLALLRAGMNVIAVDRSLESLRVLAAKPLPEGPGDLLLVQGDASRLPLRSGWAEHLLSAQMLEHLPTEEVRGQAIAEMARVLEGGGRLALSAYRYSHSFRTFLPREGLHGGKIYFHRFEPDELRELLEPAFEIERITGRLLYVFLVQARRRRES